MLLEDILKYNEQFVDNRDYEPYETDNYPNKRAVIFTCMDTRLIELLPKALYLRNGDVKFVKNAGAILTDPYDSVMKSLLVAVHALKADEIFVIAHHGCGMNHFDTEGFISKIQERGIDKSAIESIDTDLHEWLQGFDDVEASVKKSISVIKQHPLLPPNIPVHGLVIDPHTGKLDLVKNGY
ncbi:carbonic anhydrase [Aquibacillus koreensis]|uniref:carbonic anhydrase n=1 Tax=Aquibacillus koreensis TaxID=279446 RepID=A0A9X3WHV8_9BACI|nr:carbonic anhydrase [Aquibacillus koreensis]MCT2535782.1 carbonic anhydrase [Aquibacillus koreensis]MDC3420237.1 carbonic anhydrase [Aquibacillus koreensis]